MPPKTQGIFVNSKNFLRLLAAFIMALKIQIAHVMGAVSHVMSKKIRQINSCAVNVLIIISMLQKNTRMRVKVDMAIVALHVMIHVIPV